jgi:ribonuclease HI
MSKMATKMITMDKFVKKKIVITVKSQAKKPESVRVTETLNVYCDGSTLGNGKRNACGGIGIYFGPNDPKNVSEPFTKTVPTNQKTELYALIQTLTILEQIMRNHEDIEYIFHIYSDSEYTINCMEKWVPNWMANDWVKWDKKPVKNVDLLKKLSSLYYPNRKHYKLHHVMSHTGDQSQHSLGNQEADRLAVAGSRQHPNWHTR